MKTFLSKNGHWIAFGVCILTFILLALPTWTFRSETLLGYQLIFRADDYLYNNNLGRPSAAGIIALILTLFAAISFIFGGKNSGYKLFGGYTLLISSLLLFCMQGWAIIIYRTNYGAFNDVGWAFYVIASLQFIIALVEIVLGHMEYSQEKSKMYKSSGYSYLKSKEKSKK